jgi:hypothetical protein
MNILPTEFASKDSLNNSDLAKINRDYAFSAITRFTAPQTAQLLFMLQYYPLKMVIFNQNNYIKMIWEAGNRTCLQGIRASL